MRDAVSAPDMPNACFANDLKCIFRKQRMRHRYIDGGSACLECGARRFRQGAATAGHIIQDNHAPVFQINGG
jgi:hypothetical protein